MDDLYRTRNTLIQRAKDQNDSHAWEELESTYRQYIYVIIRSMNVPISHAEDVTQNVFIEVWKYLPKYEPKKQKTKFRHWVAQITRNQAMTFFRQRTSHQNKVGHLKIEMAFNPEAGIVQSEIDDKIEQEWEVFISNKAMENIRSNFSAIAIEAFHLFLEGKEVKEIAKHCDAKPDSIYKFISRIKLKLTKEIKVLQESYDF
jgi:RNA polymerase sigma-70 factor (ECF subfamily)